MAYHPQGMESIESLWVDVSDLLIRDGHGDCPPRQEFEARSLAAATRRALAFVREWAKDAEEMLRHEVWERPRVPVPPGLRLE